MSNKLEQLKARFASVLNPIKDKQEKQGYVNELADALKGKSANFSTFFKKKMLPVILACGITLSPAVLTACESQGSQEGASEPFVGPVVEPFVGPIKNWYDAPSKNPETGRTFEDVGYGVYKNPFLMAPQSVQELGSRYSDYAKNLELGNGVCDLIRDRIVEMQNISYVNINFSVAGVEEDCNLVYDRFNNTCLLRSGQKNVYGILHGEVIDNITGNQEFEKFASVFPVSAERAQSMVAQSGVGETPAKILFAEALGAFVSKIDFDSCQVNNSLNKEYLIGFNRADSAESETFVHVTGNDNTYSLSGSDCSVAMKVNTEFFNHVNTFNASNPSSDLKFHTTFQIVGHDANNNEDVLATVEVLLPQNLMTPDFVGPVVLQ